MFIKSEGEERDSTRNNKHCVDSLFITLSFFEATFYILIHYMFCTVPRLQKDSVSTFNFKVLSHYFS